MLWKKWFHSFLNQTPFGCTCCSLVPVHRNILFYFILFFITFFFHLAHDFLDSSYIHSLLFAFLTIVCFCQGTNPTNLSFNIQDERTTRSLKFLCFLLISSWLTEEKCNSPWHTCCPLLMLLLQCTCCFVLLCLALPMPNVFVKPLVLCFELELFFWAIRKGETADSLVSLQRQIEFFHSLWHGSLIISWTIKFQLPYLKTGNETVEIKLGLQILKLALMLTCKMNPLSIIVVFCKKAAFRLMLLFND